VPSDLVHPQVRKHEVPPGKMTERDQLNRHGSAADEAGYGAHVSALVMQG